MTGFNATDLAAIASSFRDEVANEPSGRVRAKLHWVATTIAVRLKLSRSDKELFLADCGFTE